MSTTLTLTPKELKSELLKAVPAKLPILIKGAPGIGKSDIVTQVAKELKMELMISHPVVSDPTDYKGLPAIVNDQAEFLPYGDLRKMIEAKKPTLCFLDDLGQAPAVVQAACMQLLLARQIAGKKISDDIVFIAATNRREDRAGVTGILEPVKSRFASIIQLEANAKEWIEWALENDMPPELIGFIHFRPALLNEGTPSNDIVNHPCPRTIANAGKLLKIGCNSMTMLAGAVGEACAIELVGFLKVCNSLPDIDAILIEPKNAIVPTDPAALYAVVSALVDRCDKDSIVNVFKYADKLPADFSVLLVRDLIRKNPKLAKHKAFTKWAVKHGDMLS